jgi:lysophospholipase L1-like esterase
MTGIDPVLVPPRGGIDIGDYSLRDFAAKWLFQQCDLAELGRYRDANAALAGDGNSGARIVLLGDSITEFWDGSGQLAGERWQVINRGIAGQNATQMLLRFEDDVAALLPKLAVLLCGTNDLRCYAGHPAAIAASALDRIRIAVTAMADIAAARGIMLALCTLPPVGRQPETWRDPAALRGVNAWVASFAAARGLDLVDYYAALADDEGFLPDGLSGDGVHPNAAGYALMLQAAREALARHDLHPPNTR